MTDSAYDIVIIGSGPGGYVAAIRAAQAGAKVALVEKERLGGTCLNRGCIPTKALIHDAALFQAVTSGRYCIDSNGALTVNLGRMMARKQQTIDTLVGGVDRLLTSYGVDSFAGTGRVERPEVVLVDRGDGCQRLATKGIILASGSVPTSVPIEGADLAGVVTSRELLEIQRLPERLVVIGGSVVGVEFACLFAALGVEVSLVGRSSFLKDIDPQLAKRLRSQLRRDGMSITIGVQFEAIRAQGGTLSVCYAHSGRQESVEGDLVLLATGRTPYTEGLGLEALGIRTNGPAIAVNERLQTSVPGIYAIGDCTGGQMLAHVASYEADVAVENILGKPRKADYRVVPNCVYTIPEIAGVGLSEGGARELGIAVSVTRFPFAANGRAQALGETEGQVRMVCETKPDGRGRVLGVHIMGPNASELIGEAAVAMTLGATAKDLACTIHAHPTLSEALMEAAMAHVGGAIHYELK